jgi:AcrR family transcriptional regulator
MNSTKSRTPSPRTALEPQRRHGKRRVADLLQAAAAVIAERGFEAATMAEIAGRAGAPIGSLYRFFPNKETLAQSLIRRYAELVKEALARIERETKKQPSAMLADALLNLMIELQGENRAMVALLDIHAPKRQEFRAAVRRRIAEMLRMRRPQLSATMAVNMAAVLLQTMKSMSRLNSEEKGERRTGAISELREMTRLYLASKLGGRGDCSAASSRR